mgnify:CR=1 FL=1
MEWIDKGYVLTTRYHGENSLIVSLLTEKNGKSSGLVHGGGSSKRRGIYQPGNFLDIIWKARLPFVLFKFFKLCLFHAYKS